MGFQIAEQGIGQRIIERWHGHLAYRAGRLPRDRLRIMQLRNALPGTGSVKKNDKRLARLRPAFTRIRGKAAGKADSVQIPESDPHPQLFPYLANRGVFRGFAVIYLSARKFPEPAMYRG